MTTLLLVRHGETDWNAERRWQGHADVPLNERGRDQAAQLIRELGTAEIDAVYSSDLSRARETAEIVARGLRVEVVLDRDLREIDVGSREGLTWPETQDGADWDGEPKGVHSERVLGAIRRIAERHPDDRVVVVTHGGSMRRVFEHLGLDDSRGLGNCTVWAFEHEDGVLRALD